MASAELKAALLAIDQATNEVAQRVQTLINQIGTGMTPEDVVAATDEANAIVARLRGIAADPNAPVPEP